jgi:hypothetical protein
MMFITMFITLLFALFFVTSERHTQFFRTECEAVNSLSTGVNSEADCQKTHVIEED